MSQSWRDMYSQLLSSNQISHTSSSIQDTPLWQIESSQWQRAAELAKELSARWVAGWAEQLEDSFNVNALLEKDGDYVLLRTTVAEQHLQLPSQSTIYAAANRSERHTRDLLGVHFTDCPDHRPWLKHQAWQKHEYPLRKDFPLSGQPQDITPPDMDYAFVKARGHGVYEIPVGPVHAGIIEPGHFRFQAVGETILNLEEHLGYVHKGIEKLAVQRSPEKLARLAARISGDSTVAHAWAACQAMEQAASVDIPSRAAWLRGIACERERIANHLGDIGAICNDVGFAFAQMQFSRLREQWLRPQLQDFGHRLMMDYIVPGGVSHDINQDACERQLQALKTLRQELDDIVPAIDMNSSLEDRLYTAGYLSPQTAQDFGVVGYVGRASSQDFDVRRDKPYAPYHTLQIDAVLEEQGDVASRVWVRVKEIFASIKLLQQMLSQLPDGDIKADWKTPQANAEGLAMIDGWRGEIISYVRFDEDNRISRFYARDPSCVNWPALEKIVLNNIVPDFPVCNKSLNGSYSGHDL